MVQGEIDDLRKAVSQINSDLTMEIINDANKTILEIVKEKARPNNVVSFQRTSPSSDSPLVESWAYIYKIIPVEGLNGVYLIQAFRAFTSSNFYQRSMTVKNGWSDGTWYNFRASPISN